MQFRLIASGTNGKPLPQWRHLQRLVPPVASLASPPRARRPDGRQRRPEKERERERDDDARSPSHSFQPDSRLTIRLSARPSGCPLIIGELRARQSHSHDRFDCRALPFSLSSLLLISALAKPTKWKLYRMPNYPLTGGSGNGGNGPCGQRNSGERVTRPCARKRGATVGGSRGERER